LRGADCWILQFARHDLQPVRLKHHILIDLADDGEASRTNADVDGRRRAVSAAVQQMHGMSCGKRLNHRARFVLAAVVDDDDLAGPAVQLRDDGLERGMNRCRAVVDRDDEGDAGVHRAMTPSEMLASGMLASGMLASGMLASEMLASGMLASE